MPVKNRGRRFFLKTPLFEKVEENEEAKKEDKRSLQKGCLNRRHLTKNTLARSV